MMSKLDFERAQAAETGRPGYDPRDLLKLFLYGYLNQIRFSRRLEAASAGPVSPTPRAAPRSGPAAARTGSLTAPCPSSLQAARSLK
ncbi:hypothetical protein ACPOL_0819 [Acidisarcina polymorpha]|uniref:Transposase InsH N-terminal domain-containing protein n=1 Tax=Acidisarcina polymorpha TaxID=2211140 RepID=A0A2Z5FTM9_9BACT|nr:hypothetical protein ACPOL_0819 [Acidisarcina polymorpha]